MADLLTTTIGGGSSLLVAENRQPVSKNGTGAGLTDIDFMGNKPLTFFVVDFKQTVAAEVGANEAIQAAIEIIQKYATIVIRGDLFDSNTQMAFAVETANDSEDWDGAGAETLVEQIEDEIITLGATYGNNSFPMNAVTCEVKTSFSNFTHS
jgi:hypothetical protein